MTLDNATIERIQANLTDYKVFVKRNRALETARKMNQTGWPSARPIQILLTNGTHQDFKVWVVRATINESGDALFLHANGEVKS